MSEADQRVILSLCDGSGAWSRPYREAGYRVLAYDIEPTFSCEAQDVRLIQVVDLPPIHGVLAAPPCTHLAQAGARWWRKKGTSALLNGLALVDACLRVVFATRPAWWALENPEGRLRHYLGSPTMIFQPWEFGDPWSKRTLLWGRFNTGLRRTPVEPIEGSKVQHIPDTYRQRKLRAVTPPGFAGAFFEANP